MCSWRPEKTLASLGTGVMNCSWSPCECQKLNLALVEEQRVLLTGETFSSTALQSVVQSNQSLPVRSREDRDYMPTCCSAFSALSSSGPKPTEQHHPSAGCALAPLCCSDKTQTKRNLGEERFCFGFCH